VRYVELTPSAVREELTIVFYVEVLEPLDPVRIVHYILEQTEKNAKCPFRFLRRIVPMTGVTNATLPSLKLAAGSVIEEGFSTPDNTQLKVSCPLTCAGISSSVVWHHAQQPKLRADRQDGDDQVCCGYGNCLAGKSQGRSQRPTTNHPDRAAQSKLVSADNALCGDLVLTLQTRVGISVVQDYYRFCKVYQKSPPLVVC